MSSMYTLRPHDVLFFRDGRPIEVGGGHGARWPEPGIIFDAIHAALHRAFPDGQASWEHVHRHGVSSNRQPDAKRVHRFGALATAGLFPVLPDGQWLFPAPKDVIPSGVRKEADPFGFRTLTPIHDAPGSGNLPKPLKYPLGNPCPPSKDPAPAWLTREGYMTCLSGEGRIGSGHFHDHGRLFDSEWFTGIGMDRSSQTQDGERIYSAQYLRLKPDVSMGFMAVMPTKQNADPDHVKDCIPELFRDHRILVAGGQQRFCTVEKLPDEQTLSRLLPVSLEIDGNFVKWTLLTPAVFPVIEGGRARSGAVINPHSGGWLPTWVAGDDCTVGTENVGAGDVLLRDGAGPGKARRRRLQSSESRRIKARLVAACIPKPLPLTGWTEALHLIRAAKESGDETPLKHGPRSLHLAVPAGAVYYFEAENPSEARKLAAALSWHGPEPESDTILNRRSSLLGEKGFGIGVCSPFTPTSILGNTPV